MRRFFDTIVEPLLETAAPETIVEIGSASGANTRKILSLCERTGATLYSIDPDPRYEVEALKREQLGQFIAYRALSLDALPQIGAVDAALIDGDHNWYTVISELQTLKNLAARDGRPFPLAILHDVGWPWGRRDAYHAPQRIPEEYRQPHGREGVLPGEKDLVGERGLNPNIHKAATEGAARSGVLTAVEDFLAADDSPSMRLVVVPGLHGLAILAPEERLEQKPALARFVDDLEASPALTNHLQRVEDARLQTLVARRDIALHLKAERKEKAQLAERFAHMEEELRKARASGGLLGALRRWTR